LFDETKVFDFDDGRGPHSNKGNQIAVSSVRWLQESERTIWADIMSKYGFPAVNSTLMSVNGTPAAGLVHYTLKVPISHTSIELLEFVARSFKIHLTQVPWCSGEIISPITHNREQVWEQLQQLTALPHVSQFTFVQHMKDISSLQNWPHGEIIAIPRRFPVTWQTPLSRTI
jgi:hypothetical protein